MKDQPLTGGNVVKVYAFILLFLPLVILGVGALPAIFLLGGYFLTRKYSTFEYFASGILATRIYFTLALVAGGMLFLYSAYPIVWGVGERLDRVYTESRELDERREKEYEDGIKSPRYIAQLRYTNRVPELMAPAWYVRRQEVNDLQIAGLTTVLENSLAGALGFDRLVDSSWVDPWGSEERFLVLISLYWVSLCALYLLLLQVLLVVPMRLHSDWVVAHGVFSGKLSTKAKPKAKEFSVVKRNGLRSYSIADELLKWAALKEAGHITEEEFQAARARLIEGS